MVILILNRIALLLLCFNLAFCYSELEEQLQKGELRKACSRFHNAVQPARRVNTTSRLSQLRELMTSEVRLQGKGVDAYLVTSTDEHQSTDVEEYEKRLQYISGFSGSYGDAVVTLDRAALWTDGRYHVQADEQIDCNWLLLKEGYKHIPTISQWLKRQFPGNGTRKKIGLNPKLVSEFVWNKLDSELGNSMELVALNVSLIDEIWPKSERPAKRSKDAFILKPEYTGKNYTTKVNETRKELRKLGADAMVVTALDEIAWLLNIRGRDVPNSPYLRSYVILDMNNVRLYVNASQLNSKNVLETLHSESPILERDSVMLKKYSDIWRDLRVLSQQYKKMLVPSHCVYSEGASHAVYEWIIPDKIFPRHSPIIYLKAVKNPVEIKKMQETYIRDAAAICETFAYIEDKMNLRQVITEINVADWLNRDRYAQVESLGNSFRTIVAFGPNSAQPHYEPTVNTNARIFPNSTVVLDSGGQYYGGTTKVTRTLHFGEPSEEMKEAYTRVLIGLIEYSNLTFPSHMKMAMADVLARAALWEIGLDYLHETGHGIGAFLGVHESPIKVHFDNENSLHQVFKPGYFLSTGPGFYQDGDFGVRLENVVEVVERPWLRHKSGHAFLGFKIVTFVPFEPKLIKLSLLSTKQRVWLNKYNEQVRQLVGSELKSQKKMNGFYWMMDKTEYVPETGQSNQIKSHPFLIITIAFIAVQINKYV